MDKQAVFRAVLARFQAVLEEHRRAAGDARDGATGDEVASEGKYDTRATESSYLARGHAMQFEALAEAFRTLDAYRLPPDRPGTSIGTGTLVEGESCGERWHYLVLPAGGGFIEGGGVGERGLAVARIPAALWLHDQ